MFVTATVIGHIPAWEDNGKHAIKLSVPKVNDDVWGFWDDKLPNGTKVICLPGLSGIATIKNVIEEESESVIESTQPESVSVDK